MKHNLKICHCQRAGNRRHRPLQDRFACASGCCGDLFGDTRRVTIIVPGDSVRALSVQEVPEVGGHECA